MHLAHAITVSPSPAFRRPCVQEELLESMDLAQYVVKGTEAEWETATVKKRAKNGGIAGTVSIKSKVRILCSLSPLLDTVVVVHPLGTLWFFGPLVSSEGLAEYSIVTQSAWCFSFLAGHYFQETEAPIGETNASCLGPGVCCNQLSKAGSAWLGRFPHYPQRVDLGHREVRFLEGSLKPSSAK